MSPYRSACWCCCSRKTQHHDGHDERVVGAEQTFEGDEQADGDEVGGWMSKDVSRSYRRRSACTPNVDTDPCQRLHWYGIKVMHFDTIDRSR